MSDTNYPDGDWSFLTGQTKSGVTLAPPDQGAAFDDINKISHSVNCVFVDITINAGKQIENAVDMNNEANGNTLRRYVVDGGGQPAFYRKGGCCENVVDDFLIRTVGKSHSDWMEGDYSDQSRKKCKGNKNNLVRRLDGKPVRVRWSFFRSERPTFTNSKVQYLYVLSALSTLYVEGKYLYEWFRSLKK